MICMQLIVEDIVDRLSNSSALSKFTVVPAYSSNINPKAFSNGTISVGLSSLEIDNGEDSVSLSRKPYTAKVKLTFYYPYAKGIFKVNEMFDKAYSTLLFSQTPLNIPKVECEAPKFKRELDAIIVESEFTLKGNTSL